MPRQPREYRAVHQAADKDEARVAMALRRAFLKLQEGVSINELALALAAKDRKRAERLMGVDRLKELLGPAAAIVKEATLRGGRVGAELLRKATDRA